MIFTTSSVHFKSVNSAYYRARPKRDHCSWNAINCPEQAFDRECLKDPKSIIALSLTRLDSEKES